MLSRFQSRKLSVAIPLRDVGVGASITRTMRSGSEKGSGFRRTASTRLNIAVLAPMPIAITLTAMAAKPGSRTSSRSPYRTSFSSVSSQRTLRVVAMRFLHLIEAAKIAARRSARILRREPRGQRVPLRQLQMRLHFVVQFPVEASAAGQGEQALYERSKCHDLASRNLATSAVAFSQFSTSTSSCFVPALVKA